MKCPNCAKKVTVKTMSTPYMVSNRRIHGVYECQHCKAVFGECYLGDSYSIVKPFFDEDPNPEQQRYFDFMTVGSEGMGRRHGWFNPQTRRVTQIG